MVLAGILLGLMLAGCGKRAETAVDGSVQSAENKKISVGTDLSGAAVPNQNFTGNDDRPKVERPTETAEKVGIADKPQVDEEIVPASAGPDQGATDSTGSAAASDAAEEQDAAPALEENWEIPEDPEIQAFEPGSETPADFEEDLIAEQRDFTSEEVNAYFENCLFIGDSRTQGLQLNSGIASAKFYAERGLNVRTVYTQEIVEDIWKEEAEEESESEESESEEEGSGKITVMDALDKEQYRKIYVCFGINELGWSYPEVFQENYGSLISDILIKQPDAEVIVYGILPVTYAKDQSDDIFNMERVHLFNELIMDMADGEGATYRDLSAAICTKYGYLAPGATTDGIHLNKPYCKKLIYYLMEHRY